MQFLFHVIQGLLEVLFGTFLFGTGESLLWVFTLGKHRVRWWEVQDANVTIYPALLGGAFWAGVVALVFYGLG